MVAQIGMKGYTTLTQLGCASEHVFHVVGIILLITHLVTYLFLSCTVCICTCIAISLLDRRQRR